MSSSTENSSSSQQSDFQKDLELLKEIPLFASFPGQALTIMAYLCSRGGFEAGDIVLEKGDDSGQALYIISGSLIVTNDDKEQEPLLKFSAGDFIGGFSLLGPMPTLFAIKAEAETKVLSLNREQFQKLMEQFPEISKLAMKKMLQALHQWEQKGIAEGSGTVFQKIGVTLL